MSTADGSIIIDTRIDTRGISNGVTQSQITISKLEASIRRLEAHYESVGEKRKQAFAADDDVKAERLDRQYNKIYDQIEIERKKLELEVSKSAQRQAEAEEKAGQI